MLQFPSSAVATWGSAVVFGNVLLTRLGVPIPAVPMLLFAGSAIAAGTLSFWPIFGAAVLGAVVGDGTWFTAGRLYGRKLLAALGRLSPAVDSRVEVARSLFERFGMPLVSVSKFVPGLGLITPPLMGTTAVDARIYAGWELASVVAWATFWLLGGAAAERELHMLRAFVQSRGGTVADILVAVALVYLLYRLQARSRARRRFARGASATNASPAATRGRPHIAPSRVLDARPDTPAYDAQCRIPGALSLDADSPEQIDGALRAHDMVIYCICPDSATAADITQRMRRHGYTRIRALRGGLDAWQRRGFPVEPLGPAGEPLAGRRAPASRDDARNAITLRGFAPRGSGGT
ncbi:putative membrane-associated protein [Paraburkholderia ribeironis]|uniref:Putative membrane-associated protein n=1 Tax=Paraburkholderia ribeironis TaxID=1247936 RepID=A0A1N7SBJ9_9BURK|nr:VTT domain-containing protein [Paraburkholderia ribeironis]SIT44703.1 putative membrane-associated protein [Paraburkholderia ribeironis]